MKRTWVLSLAILLIAIAIGLMVWWNMAQQPTVSDTPTPLPTATTLVGSPLPTAASLPAATPTTGEPIKVVADNLEIPWELEFLPDGSMLVTERPGRLLKIGTDKTAIPIAGVEHVGEGGLLGLALDPNFAQNNYIYIYLTTQSGSGLTNRIERYVLSDTEITDRTVILENIPGSRFHDGGRIAFGPDNKLYVTVGDAGDESAAQDTSSLAGKILRLNDDGTIPADNPFGNAVYSYGHRNPQGLAWDQSGNLWATEHGRSGVLSGYDEVNMITPGTNYGWPEIQGDETEGAMVAPKAHSGATTTWAPSGATFYNENLLFAGLRGESLYEAVVTNNSVQQVIPHFADEYGRLRTVKQGPDGLLYILTNNRDGRGSAQEGDDKILRITPQLLRQN